MRVPFLSNRVGDMIIHAMRAGGYLADDVSADQIRNVDNDASETDMLNLAVTLNYGSGGSSSGQLASTEDGYVFVDSDDSNATSPYTNWFIVGKGQDTQPILNPYRVLFMAGIESGPDSELTTFKIGPEPAMIGVGDNYNVDLLLGADYNGSSAEHLLKIQGKLSGGCKIESLYGMEVKSDGGGLTLNANDYIIFEPFGVAGSEGLRMKADPVADTFTIELPHITTEHALIFRGNNTNNRMLCAIGGESGVQNYDPSDIVVGGGYPSHYSEAWNQPSAHTSSLHVVSPNQSKRCVFSTWHQGLKSTVATGSHLVNFHTNMDLASGTDKIRLLSVTGYRGTDRQVVFECRSDSSVYGYAFTSTFMDVAETFQAAVDPEFLPPGTVVTVDADGKAIAADTTADPSVLGVISTQPGMTLGDSLPEENVGDTVKVAMSGTVPVKCTTKAGSIVSGDLLVSSAGGIAEKAAIDAPPGARFGKALAALEQAGEDVVTGTIKMLVFNS